MMRGLILGTFFFTVVGLGAAQAATETAPSAGESIPVDNPYREKIEKMTEELSASMGDEEEIALTRMMNGFGIVRAVRMTRDQVDEAVKGCAKDSPEGAPELQSRYDAWKKEIDPALEKNEKALEITLDNKKLFKEPGKVREYTKLFDKSAEHAIKQVNQEIVTTPESCKGLSDSLERTQETLMTFLNDLEWPIAPEEIKTKPEKSGKEPEPAPAEKSAE